MGRHTASRSIYFLFGILKVFQLLRLCSFSFRRPDVSSCHINFAPYRKVVGDAFIVDASSGFCSSSTLLSPLSASFPFTGFPLPSNSLFYHKKRGFISYFSLGFGQIHHRSSDSVCVWFHKAVYFNAAFTVP